MTPEEVKQLVERLEILVGDQQVMEDSGAERDLDEDDTELVAKAASALTLLAQEREELKEALKICANYQEPPGDQFSTPGTLKHVRAIARAALKDT